MKGVRALQWVEVTRVLTKCNGLEEVLLGNRIDFFMSDIQFVLCSALLCPPLNPSIGVRINSRLKVCYSLEGDLFCRCVYLVNDTSLL